MQSVSFRLQFEVACSKFKDTFKFEKNINKTTFVQLFKNFKEI